MSRVVGVTASVVAQEAPKTTVDQGVDKETEAIKENMPTQGTSGESSKAPAVEPASTATGLLAIETIAQTQRHPINPNRDDLFTSTSMVRQSVAESVG